MPPDIVTPAPPSDSVEVAYLYGRPGYVSIVDRALTFLDAGTNEATPLTPDQLNWCTTRGPIARDAWAGVRARMRGCHDHLNVQCGS